MTSLNAIVRRIILQEAVSAASRSIMRQAFAKYMLDLLRDVYGTIPGQLEQVEAIALTPEERAFSPNPSVVARQAAARDQEIQRLMVKFQLGKPESDMRSEEHNDSVKKIADQFLAMHSRERFSPPFDMMFLGHPQHDSVIFPKKVMDYLLRRAVVSAGEKKRGSGLSARAPASIKKIVEKMRSLGRDLSKLSTMPGISESEKNDLSVFKDRLDSLLDEFVKSLQVYMSRIETLSSVSDVPDRYGPPEGELEGESPTGVTIRQSGVRKLPRGKGHVDYYYDLREARIPRDSLRRESQTSAALLPTPIDLSDTIPLSDVPQTGQQEISSELSEQKDDILTSMAGAAEELKSEIMSFIKPVLRDTEEAESVINATDRIVELISREEYSI